MKDFEVRRQYYDPTAHEAMRGSAMEPTQISCLEPINFGPREYRLKAQALAKLNALFPGQTRKRPSRQSREYISGLNKIALGNFSIVDRFEKRKGGI